MSTPAAAPDFSLYVTPEDIPAPLRGYCRQPDDMPFMFFHHPLLVDLMPLALPAPLDHVLSIRQEQADDLLAKGRIIAHLFRYERAYRMDRLLDLLDDGHFDAATLGDTRSAAEFWQAANYVWIDSETDETDPIWTSIIEAPIPHRGFMSGTLGRRALRSLPETLTVYRGVQAPDSAAARRLALSGWSWTTDPAIAERFAQRHLTAPSRAFVASAEIQRKAIVAYLLNRGESEALLKPGTIPSASVSIRDGSMRE